MNGISTAFIAAGGNRHPSAADVEKASGLVAFATDRNIALWNPSYDGEQSGIKFLLTGHRDVVNVVKFFAPKPHHHLYLLSGSSDGEIRIWRQYPDSSSSKIPFPCCKILTEHQKSLNAIAVLPELGIFISAAASADLKVWKCRADGQELELDLIQSISLTPKYFPLAIAVTALPRTNSIVLAVGGSKSFIQIYVSPSSEPAFGLAATLTGHEGWVRSLNFCEEPSASAEDVSDLLLASASQDKFIRLWRFHRGTILPAASKTTHDPMLGTVGASLSNKAHRFVADDTKYSVTFEALLVGHEDWICNARWDSSRKTLRLLTASADNSVAIWEQDPASGVWVCTVRLGEINAQKGATTATGSTGGFWISLWHDQGNEILALGRTGSWRVWRHDTKEDIWIQSPAVSGHTRQVMGIAWATDGSYLLSTSSDQTTRMFASTKGDNSQEWHEFARPQIHGYDLSCIDTISNTQFISGADEKLLRVFNEPKAVADLLSETCGIQNPATDSLPEAANIPVLGLSNKVIESEEQDQPAQNGDHDPSQTQEIVLPRQTSQIQGIPLEDHLSRHLLWPETEKLYGHGYEISAVAASHDGTLVASACRASSLDHAVIRLFETATWHAVPPPLAAHSLTVTRLQFSPDDKYLLSVGRDRQCAIFQRDGDLAATYSLLASNPKAHSRMLLDAAWAPLEAGRVFATAGRDKAVHVWRLDGAELTRVAAISAAVPVTAVAVLPWCMHELVVLAYGLEDGKVVLVAFGQNDCSSIKATHEVDGDLCPSRTVTQLAWRPVEGCNGDCQLAVASEDSSMRLLNLRIQTLFEV